MYLALMGSLSSKFEITFPRSSRRRERGAEGDARGAKGILVGAADVGTLGPLRPPRLRENWRSGNCSHRHIWGCGGLMQPPKCIEIYTHTHDYVSKETRANKPPFSETNNH